MSATRQVAYNTLVQVIGRVITTAVSLLIVAYLTRYLGAAGYGQYTLIFAHLSLFGVVVDFGFFLVQIREIVKHPEQEGRIAGNVLGLKLVLSLVVFTVAYLAALLLYDNPVLVQGVALGIISQAAMTLSLVYTSVFQARLQMQLVAAVNVVTRALLLAMVVWAINANLGLIGIIGIVAIANVFAMLAQMLLTKPLFVVPQFDWQYWRHFLAISLPIGVVTVLGMIYFRIDTVMLGVMQGDYATGIYGAPYRVVEVLLTVPTIFMSSVFPVITQALSHDRERAERIFRKAFDFMLLTALPLAVGALFVSTPLMVFVAGQEFTASGDALRILIWATALSFAIAPFNYSLIAAGKQLLMVWPYIIATIFNVVVNLIVIPRYSYIGASFSTVATELLVLICIAWIAWRQLRLRVQFVVLGKAVLAVLVMAIVLYLLKNYHPVISIFAGAAVYGLVLVATKALDKTVIKEIIRA